MPIPTDTFWNIKILNRVFAVSAVAMMGTLIWSVFQDYDKAWRKAQIAARVWDAALTEEKINRYMSKGEKEKLEDLRGLSSRLDAGLKSGAMDFPAFADEAESLIKKHKDVLNEVEEKNLADLSAAMRNPGEQAHFKRYSQLTREILNLESQISTRMFSFNNDKASLVVAENGLQDARTERNPEKIAHFQSIVDGPKGRAYIDRFFEEISALQRSLKDKREERGRITAPVDEVRKLVTKLGGDVDLLGKRLENLDPNKIPSPFKRFWAKRSAEIRAKELMGFLNPTERVNQQVVADIRSDVSFMLIDTIDRCTTCHVNIDRKEYTEENVLAYLEEQAATGRDYQYPVKRQKPDDPNSTSPGATALPEFWHHWTAKIAPLNLRTSAKEINSISATVGQPGVKVTYNGKAEATFKYDFAAVGAAADRQNAIFSQLLSAWSKFNATQAKDPKATFRSAGLNAEVEIAASFNAAKAATVRADVFKYSVDIRKALLSALAKEERRLLLSRYRSALVDQVNVFRREAKPTPYADLDDSSVLLAHPNLELYTTADSKHPMDKVGCTSCHDGSGQETNFALAAHYPRKIWVDRASGRPVMPQSILPDEHGEGGGHHGGDLADMHEAGYLAGDALQFKDLSPKPKGADSHSEATSHASTKSAEHSSATAHSVPQPSVDPEAPVQVVNYVDPVTGQKGVAVSQMHHWVAKHEKESGTYFRTIYHEWDWPMRPPEFLEANCARCHENITDIKEQAPVLYEGRQLFTKMGCVNCHQTDSIKPDEPSEPGGKRRVGPDLRHIHEKLSGQFIDSWVWAPKAFRPATQMPHLFMLENNSSDEEIRRTRQEVLAIRSYLLATSTPTKPSDILKKPENKIPEIPEEDEKIEASVNRGRALFMGIEEGVALELQQGGVGCIACHTNLNETGAKWITTDMAWKTDPIGRLTAQKGKPSKSDIEKELKAQITEARKVFNTMSYTQRQRYALENFAEPSDVVKLESYPDGSPKPVFQHHGPELSGIGTKLTTGRTKAQARKWLYFWLIDPRHYSSYTVMPRLRLSPADAMDLAEYLLAQKIKGGANTETWAAKEIKADPAKIADLVSLNLRSQYSPNVANQKASDPKELSLLAKDMLIAAKTHNSSVPSEKAAVAEAVAGEVEKMSLQEKQLLFLGGKLVNYYGCMNCHAINGMENQASSCPNLSDWGQKQVSKLGYEYLSHHKVEEFGDQKHRMPVVNGLSPSAVTRLGDHFNDVTKRATSLAEPADVAWPHVGHIRSEWLEQKLKNSRIYDRGRDLLDPKVKLDEKKQAALDDKGNRVILDQGKPYDKLRMPTFYFNDKQVHAIITFVLSNRDKLISPSLLARTNTSEMQQIAKGRQIADKYNCVGCHRTESNQPSIQQFWVSAYGDLKSDDIPTKAPPSLRGEGNRVQHNWLYNFLLNVGEEGMSQWDGVNGRRVKIRPQPFIRMPSFPLSDEEASALTAYFNMVSVKESRELKKRIEPLLKEAAREQQYTGDMADLWPDDEWFREKKPGGSELKYGELAAFLSEWAPLNTDANANLFDPGKPDLAEAYKKALYSARFLAGLYDSKFPFNEVERPTVSDARMKLGEQFFNMVNCKQCHLVGNIDGVDSKLLNDEQKAAMQKAARAPNLWLTQRRLQRRWTRHWIQEPPTIQKNTAMVPFFSGKGVPALTDPSQAIYEIHGLPFVVGLTPEQVRKVQAHFGETSDEQIGLLMDYIYASSLKGYTAIPPAVPAAPAAAAATTPATQPAATQLAVHPADALPDVPADRKLAPIAGITAPLPPKAVKKTAIAAKPVETQVEPVVTVAAAPSIVGKITIEGPVPVRKVLDMKAVPECAKKHPNPPLEDLVIVNSNKEIANVIVYVSGDRPAGKAGVPPPAVIDQVGCKYIPHVVAVMTGQTLLMKSDDSFSHNVHTLPDLNKADNFPMPTVDRVGRPVRFSAAETFRVKCDVHPWMGAQIAVFEHPYFSVSKEDGSYSINGLPPGKYKITTWHERDGNIPAIEQEVTVEAGKPTEFNIKLKYTP